ncbi:uncharacterized protein ISCGN_019179 [Ixodes scapularis]
MQMTLNEEEEDDFTDIPQHIRVNPGYIVTMQGFLTVLETVGAACVLVLYVLAAGSLIVQWYPHVCFLVAFTYCLNNMLIVIAGISSPSTQFHLPQTTFVSTFEASGISATYSHPPPNTWSTN